MRMTDKCEGGHSQDGRAQGTCTALVTEGGCLLENGKGQSLGTPWELIGKSVWREQLHVHTGWCVGREQELARQRLPSCSGS